MGELKNMRESYELAAPQISDHEQRITVLEKEGWSFRNLN